MTRDNIVNSIIEGYVATFKAQIEPIIKIERDKAQSQETIDALDRVQKCLTMAWFKTIHPDTTTE